MAIPDASRSGTFQIGDLTVHRLGFGAMRLTGDGIWGPPDDREAAKAVLRRAVELGVTLIDTADSYGPDVSEEIIAETLHPYPADVVIATKGGMERAGPGKWSRNGRPEHLRKALEGSLKRLKVERIDLYQLHAPDPDVPYAHSVGTLEDLRREGKIRHIGVSNVSVDQLRTAMSETRVVSVQNPYNVERRDAEPVLDVCRRSRLAFLPYIPLGRGDLTAEDGPLASMAEEKGATPGQIALAWLLHHADVICPIPGTSSREHLEENVAAAEVELTEADMAALEGVAAAESSPRR